MLARFGRNCPDTLAVHAVVQSCPFADAVFDAAVAWGVMFHLNQSDQIKAIAGVSRVLKSSALFLFTSGDVNGFEPKEDTMNGVAFRYWSFTIDGYRRILEERGFALVDFHTDDGKNGYYLARKSG
jgi:SAM-dependent methyltransferase